jgi:hypothetical protein
VARGTFYVSKTIPVENLESFCRALSASYKSAGDERYASG